MLEDAQHVTYLWSKLWRQCGIWTASFLLPFSPLQVKTLSIKNVYQQCYAYTPLWVPYVQLPPTPPASCRLTLAAKHKHTYWAGHLYATTVMPLPVNLSLSTLADTCHVLIWNIHCMQHSENSYKNIIFPAAAVTQCGSATSWVW